MVDEMVIALREQMFQLERRIKPLEWDSKRNQINEFKQKQLEKMQIEYKGLLKQLSEIEKQ